MFVFHNRDPVTTVFPLADFGHHDVSYIYLSNYSSNSYEKNYVISSSNYF